MTSPNWNKIIEQSMRKARRYFSEPGVRQDVILHDSALLGRSPTAWMDLYRNEVSVVLPFLEQLVNNGCTARDAGDGIIMHEVGHYCQFPRDVATVLHWMEMASHLQHGKTIQREWGEYLNDLPIIMQEINGQSLRECHRATATIVSSQYILDDILREKVLSKGGSPESIESELRGTDIVLLREAYYQHATGKDFGVTLEGMAKDIFPEFSRLDIVTLACGFPAYESSRLGTTATSLFIQTAPFLVKMLDKREEILKGLQDQFPELVEVYKFAIGGNGIDDAIAITDLTDSQIDDALLDLIRKYGKWRYDALKKFIEKETGRQIGSVPQRKKGIGLGSSEITLNDDQIEYYTRLARTFGVYIIPRRVTMDAENSYREGRGEFKVGDKFTDFDGFSTHGKILPGISKKYLHKIATTEDTRFHIPDLVLYLDTSGSMKSPKEGSEAVLAAFILAKQYHANGAKIGVLNFSTDVAWLEPCRDLDAVYSLLCSYYGGGTALNMDKIHAYFRSIYHHDDSRIRDDLVLRARIDSLDVETRRGLLDKEIELDIRGSLQKTYEKIDNVFITDGGIANLEEVLMRISTMGKVTRNIVYILQNPALVTMIEEYHLPNTFVYNIQNPQDLRGLVIGQTKTLNGE